MNEISKKVILAGNISVGKTSIVNQYVHRRFSEQYISILGVRIDKKQITVHDIHLNLIIWDLAGESSQHNTPQSYFLGAGGILYVVDISAPPTFLNMNNDLEFLKLKLPTIPIIIVGNKVDLFSPAEVENFKKMIPTQPDYFTSAKSGQNVEEIFYRLGDLMLT
jgi:small GTP-binding protein